MVNSKRCFIFFLIALVFSFSTVFPRKTASEDRVTILDYRQVIPGEELPPQVKIQNANNNLDIVMHDGKLYFAFRTAPTHFASKDARLYVLSSKDEKSWSFETEIWLGKDLREPRFLSFNGKLFLYFAQLGDNPTAFEPGQMFVTELKSAGNWTPPKAIYEKGFIPWRAKVLNGMPYLTGYVGGENLYTGSGEPVKVYFLTTKDGMTWTVVNGKSFVTKGGASETDFVFDGEGNLFAIQRNEPGDESGWGSKLCRADKKSITDWECKPDRRKYDSPLLFTHGDEIYLVGRRNVTDTGYYDLGMKQLTFKEQTMKYLLDYSTKPKRCALWRYDKKKLEIEFILDLPSKGDTCFASVVKKSQNEYLLFNYTSPVDGPDIAWLKGQLGKTIIYSVILKFND